MARIKDESLGIDKKAIVNEITREAKEKLEEEIIKRVDYESRNKLDKMEKRIYRQKIWSLIKRDILILILIGLLGYETYILYNHNLLFNLNNKSSDKNEEVVKEENTKKEEVKDLNWYIEKYGMLLDNTKTNLIGEDKYYLYLGKYKEKDIKNSVRLNMAYQLLNLNSNDGIYKIEEEAMKEAYTKIFGTLDNYSAENFSNNCINFIYNKTSKLYMAIDIECEISNEEIIKNIKNIYEDNDKIVMEVNVGILDKEKNKLKNINSNEEMDYNKDNIQKLKIYKFIFKNNYLDEISNE